ncbi:MAG: trigger factor [Clostridiales bacterium]|nr:trigger factor [Clostridiales bacterium]
MDVKIEKKDNNVVELEITVPAEEFKKGINKSYRKNIGKFNIPGFRKGKAPKELVEKMYGEGVFYEDAVNFAIDETYPKAIDENNVEPVDRPNIDIKDIGKDKDLVYTAKVTVKPEVELGEYKGIEVSKKEYPVTDDDIDKQIESMRQKNARLITKTDGTIAKGDIAVIDFEGSIDDEPFEGGKGTNYQLEIGSGSFIEGFEDQLIGKKADEKVDVHVKFPDDYQSKKLAGKEALFKVKINEVKYKELPQLDDEFAKDVSEFETLDELKADLRKKTKERNDLRANKEFEDAVVKKVVENAKVDIPSVMVDREINYIMDDIKYRLSYQGITLEQYASYLNTTVDKMKEEYKDIAHNKVKTALVLEKIGKAESIDVSDEEIGKEIEHLAKDYNQDLEKFKGTIKDRERNIIKDDIITRKTINYLVQNVKKAE